MRGILDTYPANPALVEASFARVLLQRLSSVTFALPPGLFPSDTIRRIGRYKVYVEDALPVLNLLWSTEFSTCNTTNTNPTCALENPEYNGDDDDDDDDEYSGSFVRNKKQKRSKRKARNAPTIDLKPFRKLGVNIPLNDRDALQMARDITDNLKMILKVRRSLVRFRVCGLTCS